MYGSIWHAENVNLDMQCANQSAYMHFTEKMHVSKYAYLWEGSRMPLYPFIQSLFYKDGMSNQAFFNQGKYISIILSLFILCCLSLLFKKKFGLLYASALILITAFSVFIFKSGYFHCELLFYFLSFLSFLAMIRIFIRPSPVEGAVAGVLFAVTYFTKASVLAGVVIFFILLMVKTAYFIYKTLFGKLNVRVYSSGARSCLFCGISAALVFILAVSPYIIQNKKIFGHYFYNMNTNSFIWHDSWKKAKAWSLANGDIKGWPHMPRELIPTFSTYIKKHSPEQMADRLKRGIFSVIRQCSYTRGYFKYLSVSMIFFLYLILASHKVGYFLRKIRRNVFLALFILSYFSMYFLLYAWYTPIARPERFMLSLFLPFIFILSLLIKKYSRGVFIVFKDFRMSALNAYTVLILSAIIIDIPMVIKSVSMITSQ